MSTEQRVRRHLDAGLAAHRQGNLALARAEYGAALALAPDHPHALNLLGAALGQAGEAAAAIGCLERAARALPGDANVMGNLAQAYFAAGRYADAERAFREAIRAAPAAVEPKIGLATALALQGRLEDAHALLAELAARHPAHPMVWFNLGNVLRDQSRPAEALAAFERAVALAPDFVDARNNLAGALHALQRFADAEREYRAVLAAAPGYALGRCNLASVLIDLGRFDEAEVLCREAIAADPRLPQAHSFLGAVLGHRGRQLSALACHRAAVRLAPGEPRLVETHAIALAETGHSLHSRREFVRALALKPAATTRHTFSGVLLAQGCLAEGWNEYGHRVTRTRFREKYPQVELTRALPEPLAGRRLALLREQGLGDEIYFLRFAPQLEAAGARLVYRSSAKIRGLLERLACLDTVIDESGPFPDGDATLLVGDLPHATGALAACEIAPPPLAGPETAKRDWPMRIAAYWPPVPPSIAIPPLEDRLAEQRARLAAAGPPPYLGLTWRGGIPPGEQVGVAWTLYKTIDTPRLAAALRGFRGTVIALQRKPEGGEIAAVAAGVGRPVHDFSDLNEDLEGMLALLAVIDEYVGVSNTNMHLRACVGRTARVLVPCPAEWRWMSSGRESPWFPGFRIYRQALEGDWSGALADLAADLAVSSTPAT